MFDEPIFASASSVVREETQAHLRGNSMNGRFKRYSDLPSTQLTINLQKNSPPTEAKP
jgi:hypothetical protein